jgi:hypothetical protein
MKRKIAPNNPGIWGMSDHSAGRLQEDIVMLRGAVIAVCLMTVTPGASALAATRTTPQFPFCSWWTETTASTVNVAFPDSNAAYWTTPYVTKGVAAVILNGQYVNGRYFSVTAYNNAGGTYSCPDAAGVYHSSEITDFNILPDPGSVNPFVASLQPPFGTYTVTLRPPLAVGGTNTLPMTDPSCQPPPSPTSSLPSDLGFIILRSYLPHDGFDQVPLPSVSMQSTGGQIATLPQCGSPPSAAELQALLSTFPGLARFLSPQAPQTLTGVLPPPCGTAGAPQCPPDLTFFRSASTGGFFPNDDNKYVSALVQPAQGQVLVIRGAAPTFSPDTEAEPWQPADTELRYWSMCSNIYSKPYPVVIVKDPITQQSVLGCAADLDTVLDRENYYTYVVSHVKDKPTDAVLAAYNATWLPFSDTQPYAKHIMILRNMLGDDFPNSVQHCQAGTDPGSIAACADSMGIYYPHAATCAAATFKRGGAAACFAAAGLKAR